MSNCTFCGRSTKEIDIMYMDDSEKTYICDKCITSFWNMMNASDDDNEPDISNDKKPIIITPHSIHKELDKHIIGQDTAKKVFAVAVYNHYKMLNDDTGRIKKSNILMAGPSGCGKTLFAQTLAKMLDVPFAIADATSLTEAGYVGDDVENCLVRLIQAADGDIKKAERGIVFIDEIDKIARKGANTSITRDVSGEGVQTALLKIVEGAEVSVPLAGGRKHPNGNNAIINTKNILFICGGAFSGMFDVEEEKRSVGFTSVEPGKGKTKELTPELLMKYGMLQEFIGRFPVLVKLSALTEEDLVRVLTEPKENIISEYQMLFNADGVKLTFENSALRQMAKISLEKNTGARGLRSVLEDTMLDIMYDIPSDKDIEECIVTEDTIINKKATIIKHGKKAV